MRRRPDSAPASTAMSSCGLFVAATWVIWATFVLLFAHPAEAQTGRVPIGPKGRVIKDCEWRYRHANVTDDVLSCKKCVKDYELRFPPRRLDVVKMRQTCVKPYTPKEAAIILCNAFHRPSEKRANCIRCVEEYDLPDNATKIQVRDQPGRNGHSR
uniref:Putative secreted protein n=1 Tax=Rhipicephalus microplus TaxID=6941 RepID=A0A6M2DC12_RHIMP